VFLDTSKNSLEFEKNSNTKDSAGWKIEEKDVKHLPETPISLE
jgi:hypothetical protein